jgi:hypothetical protein
MNQTATVLHPAPAAVPLHETSLVPAQVSQSAALILDSEKMGNMFKLAEIMATGKVTIPPEYRGNPGDCLAVVMQAVQWGMNPFAVAQKTYFVSGKIGYEAQLVNAVIASIAPVKDRIHYEWFGDWTKVVGKFEIKRSEKGEYRVPGWKLADEEGLGVKVWATFRGEDEPRVLELLLAQARTRNSTLWADDPRQQLAYLAVKRWSRLYCPDVTLGVYTPDELDQIEPIDVGSGSTEERPSTGDRLKEAAKGAAAKATKKDEAEAKPATKPATKPGAPTPDEIVAALNKASTPEAVAAALDLARGLPDGEGKEQVRATYQRRVAELKASAAASAPPPAEASNEDPGDDFATD